MLKQSPAHLSQINKFFALSSLSFVESIHLSSLNTYLNSISKMKVSTLFTAFCLVGVIQCAVSLDCYFCASRAECRRPKVETCKYDGDVCINAKVNGQSVVKVTCYVKSSFLNICCLRMRSSWLKRRLDRKLR